MNKLIYTLLLLIFCFSCSHQKEKIVVKNAKPKEEKKIVDITPTKIMTLEVKGMSCEMNCGGSIRKELKKTGAVSRVEFNWVEEAEKQQTKISFDDTKISEKDIVNLIESINEGQFTVYPGKSEKISPSTNSK